MVNKERLVSDFLEFVRIDSESKHEGDFAKHIARILHKMGAKVFVDNAGEKIGGETGNVIGKFPGNKPGAPPVLLAAHMDTVKPGRGIEPVIEDGIIRSGGDTVLGSDDKSGIAQIIEAIRVLKEKSIPHPPIDVVFTVAEEIGLHGAFHMNYGLVDAKLGFCLDAERIGDITIKAPTHKKLDLAFHGRAAHAALSAGQGINAIQIAAYAIGKIPVGKIDDFTTANMGTIHGGAAPNIIPSLVKIEGEVRGHKTESIEEYISIVEQACEEAVQKFPAQTGEKPRFGKFEMNVTTDFTAFELSPYSFTVQTAVRAAEALGLKVSCEIGMGGSDASIFNQNGIEVALLGTGMSKVHSPDEFIRISDLAMGAGWIIEVLRSIDIGIEQKIE